MYNIAPKNEVGVTLLYVLLRVLYVMSVVSSISRLTAGMLISLMQSS